MHSCGEFLHSEQRMHGNYFEWYLEYVLLLDDMGDDRFSLLYKFDQLLQQTISFHLHQEIYINKVFYME